MRSRYTRPVVIQQKVCLLYTSYILGGRNTYNYFLGDFPGHKNYDRDVLVVCDEPEKENSVNQLDVYKRQVRMYPLCSSIIQSLQIKLF